MVHDALCRAGGIDPTLIANNFCAAFQAAGQHGAHAIIEISIEACESRITPRAHLRSRDGRFRHGFETQVIQVALFGVEPCGFNAVAPPGGAGADA